jgi:hypothetical protein
VREFHVDTSMGLDVKGSLAEPAPSERKRGASVAIPRSFWVSVVFWWETLTRTGNSDRPLFRKFLRPILFDQDPAELLRGALGFDDDESLFVR